MGNILIDMMGLLNRKRVVKKTEDTDYLVLGRRPNPDDSMFNTPKMYNELISIKDLKAGINSGEVTGSGTTNYIPVYSDGANSVIGDSQLRQSNPNSAGLYQMRMENADRFIINKPSSITSGDPEYLITQDGNFKVSFGWDDDGGGFGYLYNWSGAGLKLGSAGNNPMLEIKTTAGSEEIDLHKSIKFVDYGSGTYPGTVAYTLAVDALGNVIETTDGGGTVTGTGTANTLTKWSTGGTGIENSVVNDTGSEVIIDKAGIVIPTALTTKLQVNGDIGIFTLDTSANPIYMTLGFGGGAHFSNMALGRDALKQNTSGISNIAVGLGALENATDADNNTAIGQYALTLIQGDHNTAIGYAAGYNRAGGTNAGDNRESIYIGSLSQPGPASGGSSIATENQIVIGYAATGFGSNTVTLGNDSIVGTYLKGNVVIGSDLSSSYKLNVSGDFKFDDPVSGSGYMQSDYGDHRISIFDVNNNRVFTVGDLDSGTADLLNINASNVNIAKLKISGVPVHADNNAAITAGLTTGEVYRTDDFLKIVH